MARPNPLATDRPAKAVLVGGECDGMVVRIGFPVPPILLTVLIDQPKADANGAPLPADEAFVAPTTTFPNTAAGRPVTYQLFPVDGVPEGSRVAFYVPQGTPGLPVIFAP